MFTRHLKITGIILDYSRRNFEKPRKRGKYWQEINHMNILHSAADHEALVCHTTWRTFWQVYKAADHEALGRLPLHYMPTSLWHLRSLPKRRVISPGDWMRVEYMLVATLRMHNNKGPRMAPSAPQ